MVMALINNIFRFPISSHLLTKEVYITLENYKISALALMDILVVLLLLLIIGFVFLFKRSIKREERIKAFSISRTYEISSNLTSSVLDMYYMFAFLVSRRLDNSVFLNKQGQRYNKYLGIVNTRFVKGRDYIINKILITFIFLSLMLIVCVITRVVPNSVLVLCVILFGFFIPNLYYEFRYQTYKNSLRASFYTALMLISDALGNGYNLDAAIKKACKSLQGPINKELMNTSWDLNTGLSQYEAVYRLAKKTRLKEAYTLANNVYTISKLGSNLNYAFELTQKDIASKKKLKLKYKNSLNITYTFALAFALLPLMLILDLYLLNNTYFSFLIDTMTGRLLLVVMILLYLSYIYIVKVAIKAVTRW